MPRVRTTVINTEQCVHSAVHLRAVFNTLLSPAPGPMAESLLTVLLNSDINNGEEYPVIPTLGG